MSGDENFCFYEHPLSRCGAQTQAQRLACKYYSPGYDGACTHFNDDLDRRCDNHFANFEAYAILDKPKKGD